MIKYLHKEVLYMDIRLKLSEVFASKSPNAKLEDETKLEDLGLDSLDKIELLYAIEESFGIEFENEEMQSFITIGDIVKSIGKKYKFGREFFSCGLGLSANTTPCIWGIKSNWILCVRVIRKASSSA